MLFIIFIILLALYLAYFLNALGWSLYYCFYTFLTSIFCYKFSIHIYLAASWKIWYVEILLSAQNISIFFSLRLSLLSVGYLKVYCFISRYLWIFQINFCYCHSNLILLLFREDTLYGFSSSKFSNIWLLAQNMVCLNAGFMGTSKIYIFHCLYLAGMVSPRL